MGAMLRILFAHNRYLVPGGEDVSTASEVDLLRGAGHAVDLWETSNETISDIGRLRAGLRAVWSRDACAELSRRLAQKRYDVLHVQNHFPMLSPAVHRVATRHGVATVQHLRNFRMMCVNAGFFRDGADCRQCSQSFAPWRGVVHRCYRDSAAASLVPAMMVGVHKMAGTWTRHVDAYIAISNFVRDVHRDAGYPADRIFVRHCFVLPTIAPSATRTASVVAAARFTPEKGLGVLIEAWQRRPRNAVLHIAGTGPDEQRLRALAEDDPSIRFVGQLPLPDLIGLMATARAVVNPCLWMEPFGRTPMEAGAVGTPAIVSRVGGLVDTVEHGRNGLLVEPGDVAELDQAVTILLTDDGAFRSMSEGAVETFAEKFSPGVMLRATEAIYESAIRRREHIAGTGRMVKAVTYDSLASS